MRCLGDAELERRIGRPDADHPRAFLCRDGPALFEHAPLGERADALVDQLLPEVECLLAGLGVERGRTIVGIEELAARLPKVDLKVSTSGPSNT